ncbi:LPXTG cell wall anchor domain-containing protein [Yeosuana sp.]|uniref:LPXTG cell wall anchor domain-containing protein n=1 Tax=Yeosuana sp. TaxID=2529388 RepID=UPI004054DB37|tara:strand:+ start:2513 stop:2695 length:183 start_codon:yes stop_codon:yes gene_type:complete
MSLPAEAQCAMCRAVLENEEGQNTGAEINNGIIYLMAIPYILIAGIGVLIYKKFFRVKKQ